MVVEPHSSVNLNAFMGVADGTGQRTCAWARAGGRRELQPAACDVGESPPRQGYSRAVARGTADELYEYIWYLSS